MSDHDVFNTQTQTPPAEIKPEDLLASIKNEQGEQKYRTLPDAIKALENSQAFIPQLLSEKKALEEEVVSLREKATKASAIDEVLDKLRTAAPQENTEKGTPSGGGLSEEQVAALVRKALEEQNQSAKVASNVTRVNNELVNLFGNQQAATDAVVTKCRELNTDPDKLRALAAESPELVLSLFGTKAKSSQPTTSSVIPLISTPNTEVPPPQKSILTGATSREQKDYYLKVKEETLAKLGVSN